jgi:MarR family transcriptional regulator, lower aerobic nicotinate degradation pathway regulator
MATTTESPLAKAGVKPPRELVQSPSFLLKRLGFAAKDRVTDAFEEAGASAYHYAVLAVLEEGDRETQATIADALAYDRSYLVGLLDELEERGLIERRRDPADRRRHIVRVTAAGKKTLARLRAVHEKVDDDFFAPLSADERTTLHTLLLRLAAHHDPRYAPNGH